MSEVNPTPHTAEYQPGMETPEGLAQIEEALDRQLAGEEVEPEAEPIAAKEETPESAEAAEETTDEPAEGESQEDEVVEQAAESAGEDGATEKAEAVEEIQEEEETEEFDLVQAQMDLMARRLEEAEKSRLHFEKVASANAAKHGELLQRIKNGEIGSQEAGLGEDPFQPQEAAKLPDSTQSQIDSLVAMQIQSELAKVEQDSVAELESISSRYTAGMDEAKAEEFRTNLKTWVQESVSGQQQGFLAEVGTSNDPIKYGEAARMVASRAILHAESQALSALREIQKERKIQSRAKHREMERLATPADSQPASTPASKDVDPMEEIAKLDPLSPDTADKIAKLLYTRDGFRK